MPAVKTHLEPTAGNSPRRHAPRDGEFIAADWHTDLRTAIRDPRELCRVLNLSPEWAEQAVAATADFPLFVPRDFAARMRPGDPNDPLLRQVLPLAEESHTITNFSLDPVGDQAAELTPGLLRKYQGRALLVTTGVCAVHCRYCFRRHFPYGEAPHSLEQWQPALQMIAADDTISEVILSGGDPLALRDELLAELAARIAAIAHVRRLRVHTRLPVMIPQRVNEALLAWLTDSRLAPVMVIHANHANELTGEAAAAVRRLVQAGIPTLNQAVLLRGVNDSVAALAELSERLLDLGAVPYYLHQLDRVQGAAHFEVPIAEGLAIMEQLRARLPGYAVPRYVQETAGAAFKVPLG